MGLFTRLFGKKKTPEEKARKQEIAEQGLKSDEEFSASQRAAKEKEAELAKAAKEAELAEVDQNEETVKEEGAEEKKAAPQRKQTVKSAAAPAAKKPVKSKEAVKEKVQKAPIEENKVEETIAESKPSRSGKFEIKKSKDGRFVFNLYASNYVIIATSQVYSSSTAAMNGIKSVIANAPTAPIEDQTLKSFEAHTYPKWELYQDKGGQYRFRLCASNGSCVCHSQGYTTKNACKNGIDSIIRSSQNAEIDKTYIMNKDEK